MNNKHQDMVMDNLYRYTFTMEDESTVTVSARNKAAALKRLEESYGASEYLSVEIQHTFDGTRGI